MIRSLGDNDEPSPMDAAHVVEVATHFATAGEVLARLQQEVERQAGVGRGVGRRIEDAAGGTSTQCGQ